MIEVRTQIELDAALTKANGEQIACIGNGSFVISDSSTVTAYDSSTVTAYGSSTVRAYDSSTVWASDSSTVWAYGSSTVWAYGSSTVRAYGSSTVWASKYVAVTKHGRHAKVSGGVLIEVPKLTTAQEWCDYYGAEVKRGVAMLYKAVDDDYATNHSRAAGIFYKPGTSPQVPDWDGGVAECGGGLHFSPHAFMARRFNDAATKYVACPVKVSEIVVHPDASMPDKVKAPRVFGKVYECNQDGKKLTP